MHAIGTYHYGKRAHFDNMLPEVIHVQTVPQHIIARDRANVSTARLEKEARKRGIARRERAEWIARRMVS